MLSPTPDWGSLCFSAPRVFSTRTGAETAPLLILLSCARRTWKLLSNDNNLSRLIQDIATWQSVIAFEVTRLSSLCLSWRLGGEDFPRCLETMKDRTGLNNQPSIITRSNWERLDRKARRVPRVSHFSPIHILPWPCHSYSKNLFLGRRRKPALGFCRRPRKVDA